MTRAGSIRPSPPSKTRSGLHRTGSRQTRSMAWDGRAPLWKTTRSRQSSLPVAPPAERGARHSDRAVQVRPPSRRGLPSGVPAADPSQQHEIGALVSCRPTRLRALSAYGTTSAPRGAIPPRSYAHLPRSHAARARRNRAAWCEDEHAICIGHRWRVAGAQHLKDAPRIGQSQPHGVENMKIQALLTAIAVDLKKTRGSFFDVGPFDHRTSCRSIHPRIVLKRLPPGRLLSVQKTWCPKDRRCSWRLKSRDVPVGCGVSRRSAPQSSPPPDGRPGRWAPCRITPPPLASPVSR